MEKTIKRSAKRALVPAALSLYAEFRGGERCPFFYRPARRIEKSDVLMKSRKRLAMDVKSSQYRSWISLAMGWVNLPDSKQRGPLNSEKIADEVEAIPDGQIKRSYLMTS